ncbi:hypothetical protein [Streptomyces sp. NPDC048277]|uniref:hypothetical protein n=1 Tax=Streptomyces sp. NPDC048277 TaxID=3155027 RepID=UPI0033E915D3
MERHGRGAGAGAGTPGERAGRARTFGEGGRGLLLVGQLTRRWGTRHAGTGKTVRAEQSLTGG